MSPSSGVEGLVEVLAMTISLPAEARCGQCGYVLRGLSEDRCPECGRAFDPGDPKSFRIPRRYRPARPWLPPLEARTLRSRARLVVVAGLLSVASLPPPPMVRWEDLAVFGLLVGIAVAGRLVLSGRYVSVAAGIVGLVFCTPGLTFIAHGREPSLMQLLGWLMVLLMLGGTLEFLPRWRALRAKAADGAPVLRRRHRRALAVVVALFWVNVLAPPGPGVVTFWLNAPFITAKADAVIASSRSDAEPHLVGLWLVGRIIFRPRGTIEFLTAGDHGDRSGFVYVPPGQELGLPFRARRIWPWRDWYFFRFEY